MHAEHAALTEKSLDQLIGALKDASEPQASAAATEIGRRFHSLIRKYWWKQKCGEFPDFFQDVMLRLFRALPALHDSRGFPGYFRRIVIATAADYWRSNERHLEIRDEVDVEALEQAFDFDLTATLVVQSFLDFLPPQERKIMELSVLNDMSPRDIAAMLGITPGAVRMGRARALQRIKAAVT